MSAVPARCAALYRLQPFGSNASLLSRQRGRVYCDSRHNALRHPPTTTDLEHRGKSGRWTDLVAARTPLNDDRVFSLASGSKLITMRRSSINIIICLTLATVTFALLHPTGVQAQQKTKRLILKDGSYQAVVKYEVQGNRVHYLSAERYEWEDIPSSLIDWDATKKYEADLSSGKLAKVEETPEEKEEREKEEANSPEIAPGLRLPGSGGVFLFDQFQDKPELAEIVQNGSEVNKSKGKNTIRAAIHPLASSKQAFEVKGMHAQTQSHVPRPTIYVDIDEGPVNDVALNDRFRIVRAEMKNGVRVVGVLKTSASGKMSEQSTVVPVKIEKLGTGEWVKVTPMGDLAPGEYAIVEMLGADEMNLYVWDFGVNPSAPANPNTWQPAANVPPATK